jgi:tRNA (guanine-N(7)-)-methyltransferase
MRKKRNLEAQISACGEILWMPRRQELNIQKALEHKEYIDFASVFGSRKVEMEIGCGKGGFICEMAARRPDTAFLAVEVSKNVIVEGCKKALALGLTNVRFLNCAAELLPCFLPPESMQRLYLNFSCPYPKHTYASHRLTHPRFLQSYRQYLAPGAEIHQKTDNMHFFEYSIEQFSRCGYKIKNVSLDLHNSSWQKENIMTEYETKFSQMGLPIYRLEAEL